MPLEIGSASGKNFRNYAQQFTLDMLIGYANQHLVDLSRRYQLERVKQPLSVETKQAYYVRLFFDGCDPRLVPVLGT